MAEPKLVVEGLAHAYGETPILEPVSFELFEGELLAVLGPSGCGKTTLLRALAGLVTPARGRVRMEGELVCEEGRELQPAEERRVGLVFQNYALFGHMSVAANVGFGLRPRDPKRVQDLLEKVGLGSLGERDPRSLSGGQQQRVALARALAPRPRLILLDEPFANVDTALRVRLGLELRELLASEGTPAILVTHDRDDALRNADRVAVFVSGAQGGRLAQIGTPVDLYRRPCEAAVAHLSGRAAWLPGTARALVAETALGDVELLEPHQGPVEILLRPEQLQVEASEEGTLQIRGSSFSGSRYLIQLALGELELWGESADPLAKGPALAKVSGPCWALPG